MAGAATSKVLQRSIAERGIIVGDTEAVRSSIQSIVRDGRFRKVSFIYSGQARRGKVGELLVGAGGPVKGVRSEEESAIRMMQNGLIALYCNKRHEWRTIKVELITGIEVYTGRRYIDGAAEKKMIEVRVIA